MPIYDVHICRTSFSHKTFRVEAISHHDAASKVMDLVEDTEFPNPNSAQYSVEGSNLIEETKPI
jgi:hypothetical protein